MMTAQVGHGDGRRNTSKAREDGSYQTAQVGHGDGRRKKMCGCSDAAKT